VVVDYKRLRLRFLAGGGMGGRLGVYGTGFVFRRERRVNEGFAGTHYMC